MSENVEFTQQIRTGMVVKFLVGRSDQVASTKDIAEAFEVGQSCAERALRRLEKVGRVAEIHPSLWHLE